MLWADRGKDGAASEVQDVIKDHNEIRDAAGEVDRHDVGSDSWWTAVLRAREANSDHMAEEEEDLADFRHYADRELRHGIAVAFLTYEFQHPAGITTHDKDPDDYVRNN